MYPKDKKNLEKIQQILKILNKNLNDKSYNSINNRVRYTRKMLKTQKETDPEIFKLLEVNPEILSKK